MQKKSICVFVKKIKNTHTSGVKNIRFCLAFSIVAHFFENVNTICEKDNAILSTALSKNYI